MSQTYEEKRTNIQKYVGQMSKGMPEFMKSYMGMYKSMSTAGALEPKVKELIALALAVGGHCDGCISFHTKDALKAGATKEEILETLSVSILMGGGPSVTYAAHVMEAMEEYSQ